MTDTTVVRKIRINHPGAGEWIMERAGGVFRPDMDHSLATYRGDEILGGFVLSQYLGNSIAVHDAGCDPTWCPRELLWMMFHYVFRQLNCGLLIAPTQSDNYRALALNLRAGFRLETVICNAVAPGVHLMVLTMDAGACRWLRVITPQSWYPGEIMRKVA